ncbi:MAG TPA: DUF4465 domain-containing protein [Isosphaeraceae bacterium]|nr:DUF4465 domain-containing protein [Isosphaeraceae bacterium]
MTLRQPFVTLLGLGLAIALAAPGARGGDIVVNFNDLSYPNGSFDPGEGFPAGPAPGTGSYDNGWDLNGGFTSNGTFFSNAYDTTFNSWSGWAYSNVNDPTTTGPSPFLTDFNHQFAAITGTAPGGSGNYGISSGSGAYINLPSGTSPVSFEVTNTTYSFLSMTLGDGFGKKFSTGDFFELKIFGYSGLNGTGTQVGEVDFFLANYTSANSLPVDVWTLVNLTSLADAQSLGFDYASSDVGQFGINTPEFFAMDDLTLSTTSVPEPSSVILALAGLGIVGLFASHRHWRSAVAR